jgi:hypothetical protein
VHTAWPMPTLIDGKHYTVFTPQCAYSPAKDCPLRIVDTTDPTHPALAGQWFLPERVHGASYTPENFAVDAKGRILVPWMHGGTWLLDINATGTPQAPATLGYFFEARDGALAANAPDHRAADFAEDIMFVADLSGGIDAWRYTG